MSADLPGRPAFELPERRDRIDRDIDEELRLHLDERTAELIAAGLDPATARARAVARFGDIAAAREEIRGIDASTLQRRQWWGSLADAASDLRYAVRSLVRQPSGVLMAVGVLALGMGANMAIYDVVDQLLLSPPPHVRDAGQVVRIRFDGALPQRGRNIWERAPYRGFRRIHDAAPAFSAVAAYTGVRLTYGTGAEARPVAAVAATANYHALLGARPFIGRFFTGGGAASSEASHEVILSHGFWSGALGAAASVVGRDIRLAGTAYRIVGVAPEGFRGDGAERVDVWIPLDAAVPGLPADWREDPDLRSVAVIGRLRSPTERPRALQQATAAYRASSAESTIPDSTAAVRFDWLIPGRSNDGSAVTPESRVLIWLQVVAAAVLIIAAANVTGLLLLRMVRRRREMAVRLALGISRARLLRQTLGESVLIALAAGILAIAVATPANRVIRAVLTPALAPRARLGMEVGAVMLLLVVIAGVAIGLVPTFLSSRMRVAEELRSGDRAGTNARGRAQQLVLFAQVALSMTLLVGAGLFVRSLRTLVSLDLGLEPQRVLVVRSNLAELGRDRPEIDAFFERALERVRTLPGVAHASVGQSIPYSPSLFAPLYLRDRDTLPGIGPGGLGAPTFFAVTPGYLETVGLRLVQGRDFGAQDQATSPRVVLVDQTMARTFWPGEPALGQCLRVGADTMPCSTVVGVVRDTRRALTERVHSPRFYVPLAQSVVPRLDRYLFVKVAGRPKDAIATVRSSVVELDPQQPFVDVFPLADLVGAQLRPWRVGATLFTTFGALAMLLVGCGLYAALGYAVACRRRELGVRVALGAPRHTLLRDVLGDAARTAFLGVVAGAIIIALVGGRLAPLLFQTSPLEPSVIFAAAALIVCTALIAAAVPAVRALRTDPLTALRSD